MTPQHTGARTDDLTTWDTADYETSQHLASTGQSAAALPGAPVPTAEHQPADIHHLAA